MERVRAQELFVGRVPKRIGSDFAETRQSGAGSGKRGRSVREGRKDFGGGVLRADAGTCVHGTAGGVGSLQRWKGGIVGRDAESARNTRRGEGRAGAEERRRHGKRDAARRRLWA